MSPNGWFYSSSELPDKMSPKIFGFLLQKNLFRCSLLSPRCAEISKLPLLYILHFVILIPNSFVNHVYRA